MLERARSPHRVPQEASRAHISFLVTALVVGVGLTLSPVPAHAVAITVTTATNAAIANFDENGIATCTVSNSGDTEGAVYPVNGVADTKAVSETSTITDDSNPADVTTATSSARSTVKATQAGGSLAVDWDATATVTVDPAQGPATDCDALVVGQATHTEAFTLTESTWATFRGHVAKDSLAQVFIVRTAPATPPFQEIFLFYGSHSHVEAEVLLPPGTYLMNSVLQQALEAPQAPGDPTSLSGSVQLDTVLAPVGSSTGKATGPGGKYVKLADSLSCSGDSLEAKWKPAAGKGKQRKVAKATFFVNGDKVKTVKNPDKGQKTKLKNLDTGLTMNVTASLKLVSGAAKTLTRSYLGCS